MSCEDDFETYLKHLQTNKENREKSEEDVPNFQVFQNAFCFERDKNVLLSRK